jgi:hypothetical protein
MANIKLLADQIREELKNPTKSTPGKTTPKQQRKVKDKPPDSGFLTLLQAFDTTDNKSMVHVRFDEKTLRLMNQFKLATGIDISKFVAFAVKELVDQTPDIKQIIKQFIQNSDL